MLDAQVWLKFIDFIILFAHFLHEINGALFSDLHIHSSRTSINLSFKCIVYWHVNALKVRMVANETALWTQIQIPIFVQTKKNWAFLSKFF